MAIYYSPRTPQRAIKHRNKATLRRKAKFYHAVDTRGISKLKDVFDAENIYRSTAYYWLQLRKQKGSPGTRRTGKQRPGRPFKIGDESLGQLLAKSNPVRTERLEHQIELFPLSLLSPDPITSPPK